MQDDIKKKNKKKKHALPYTKINAGNVIYNNAFFNHLMGNWPMPVPSPDGGSIVNPPKPDTSDDGVQDAVDASDAQSVSVIGGGESSGDSASSGGDAGASAGGDGGAGATGGGAGGEGLDFGDAWSELKQLNEDDRLDLQNKVEMRATLGLVKPNGVVFFRQNGEILKAEKLPTSKTDAQGQLDLTVAQCQQTQKSNGAFSFIIYNQGKIVYDSLQHKVTDDILIKKYDPTSQNASEENFALDQANLKDSKGRKITGKSDLTEICRALYLHCSEQEHYRVYRGGDKVFDTNDPNTPIGKQLGQTEKAKDGKEKSTSHKVTNKYTYVFFDDFNGEVFRHYSDATNFSNASQEFLNKSVQRALKHQEDFRPANVPSTKIVSSVKLYNTKGELVAQTGKKIAQNAVYTYYIAAEQDNIKKWSQASVKKSGYLDIKENDPAKIFTYVENWAKSNQDVANYLGQFKRSCVLFYNQAKKFEMAYDPHHWMFDESGNRLKGAPTLSFKTNPPTFVFPGQKTKQAGATASTASTASTGSTSSATTGTTGSATTGSYATTSSAATTASTPTTGSIPTGATNSVSTAQTSTTGTAGASNITRDKVKQINQDVFNGKVSTDKLMDAIMRAIGQK